MTFFGLKKGPGGTPPTRNPRSTPPGLHVLLCWCGSLLKSISLHTMRIYLQTYQWLQTVALFRCDGYTTGSFWAMMCNDVHKFICNSNYRLNRNFCNAILHCLFICSSVHSYPEFLQPMLIFPKFLFLRLDRSTANSCVTTMMNLTFPDQHNRDLHWL